MVRLLVVPEAIMTMLIREGIPYSILKDVESMSGALSVHDMAEIHMAQKQFPFEFDQSLEIQFARSPLVELAESSESRTLYERLNERIETLTLRESAERESFTPVYTLYPVDETLWVAVLQRQDSREGDPHRELLSSNHAFFDALMAQTLHLHSFERVCSTNLFTYYLKALPAQAA